MILFPGSKINLGLHVLSKRADLYHSIESIVLKTEFTDVLEVCKLPDANKSDKVHIVLYNASEEIDAKQNICYKAYQILDQQFSLDPVQINLIKNVPSGAGLGGGSADGTATLHALNSLFNLSLNSDQIKEMSLQLGSDCPLFVDKNMYHISGRGEILKELSIDLSKYWIVIAKPQASVSTATAYSKITCNAKRGSLLDIIQLPVIEWRDHLFNDFEEYVSNEITEIMQIKDNFYNNGAIYASMSGSGSAVYGLFESEPECNLDSIVYKGRIKAI
ncbi:MAG TPA: 4-(cytidine 5'-diphospho)-2-C-methyl-D-erythritol kinase [Bacteroidia bacterium]|nr:4-(cytidine 5'-diphospho)-2-C-methyl-D-erythritol kinase [Bacteroidia bacterium]HNT79766.1 4-(cytidine 5'-diphospho)-2-C-methyl-D-erythritol kinase [Bacteroidia bacterium]